MPLNSQKDYQLLFYETSPPRIKPKFERSPTTTSILQSQYQQQQQQQQRVKPGNLSPTSNMRTIGGSTSAINEQVPLKISPPSAIRTAAEFITHHRSSTTTALTSSNLMLKSSSAAPTALLRQSTGGGGEYSRMHQRNTSLFRNRGPASLTSLELKPATVEGNHDHHFEECHHPA